jgi:ubiquinone/menaquinone biosynthesis C-methylase UbiE
VTSPIYDRSAPFYDDMFAFKDYGGEADYLAEVIRRHHPTARSLLDVACGTGRHLEHFRRKFEVEGLDMNPRLLDIARQRLSGVTLYKRDMTEFDLGRTFDVVTVLFGSIAFARTVQAMHQSIETLARHVAPCGLLLVEPLWEPDAHREGELKLNVVDKPDLKIAWMYANERVGDLAHWENHFLVATPDGIDSFVEVQEAGLFTDGEYRNAFGSAGLAFAEWDPEGPWGRGLYVARRPEYG